MIEVDQKYRKSQFAAAARASLPPSIRPHTQTGPHLHRDTGLFLTDNRQPSDTLSGLQPRQP
jgi:hypothetical protein